MAVGGAVREGVIRTPSLTASPTATSHAAAGRRRCSRLMAQFQYSRQRPLSLKFAAHHNQINRRSPSSTNNSRAKCSAMKTRWSSESPFAVITDKTPWIEVVGVVGHIRSVSLETDLLPQVYWPKAQLRPETQRSQERGTLVVRTVGRPELFTSAVVEQIWVWGAGVGLVLAWMAGRALKTQLYGVGSADAGALAFAPALLLAH